MFPEDDTESEERQEVDKIDLQPLFDRLAKSKFRSSFYLNAKDKAYIKAKGWEKIEQGTRETIAKRLAPAFIPNDGKQTPMRHGIFTDRKGTDIYHSRHHGVAEKKRPVNVIKRLINVSGEY